MSFDIWAELLRFVQLAHNTAYSTTIQQTPHSSSLDVQMYYMSISSTEFRLPPRRKTQLDYSYSKQTVENLQFAYELARRNVKERADKQAVVNDTPSFPSFESGEQVSIQR